MPPDRQADAFAPRTSLHGHIYRHRPNGLETLKTTHLSQENRRELLSGHVPMDVLTRSPERRLWRGELRTGFAKVSSRRSLKEDAGVRASGRSKAPPGISRTRGRLLSVDGGLRTLLERLEVPDHAFACVVREFEILGEFKGVGRASIFAQAAEHATAQVVGEFQELFAAGFFIALAGNNDQVFRAGHGAQVARNTESLVGIWVDIQPRRAPVPLGYLRPLRRILLSINFLGMLISERHAKSLDQVH